MPSFNRVTLIGNLTRDPETRDLPSGTTLCEFGLAMSRHYKTQGGEDREETAFVDCTAFGKQAEVLQQYCQKGRPLFVEGRLKYDTWDDKSGGGKRSKLSVVVENFQFLGSRDGDGGGHDRGPFGGSSGRGERHTQSSLYDRPAARRDGPQRDAVSPRDTDVRGESRDDVESGASQQPSRSDRSSDDGGGNREQRPARTLRGGRPRREPADAMQAGGKKFKEADIPF
jgi:single-strand DNA-binding protein